MADLREQQPDDIRVEKTDRDALQVQDAPLKQHGDKLEASTSHPRAELSPAADTPKRA